MYFDKKYEIEIFNLTQQEKFRDALSILISLGIWVAKEKYKDREVLSRYGKKEWILKGLKEEKLKDETVHS